MGITNCKLRRNSIKFCDVTSNHGNWNDLPEDILTSILTLLPSIADLTCAASVSHQWNAAAVAIADSNNEWSPQPPWVLYAYIRRISSLNIEWVVIPIVSGPTSKSYLHSFQTTGGFFCAGHHLSKLILLKDASIVLRDIFSGEQIRSPKLFPTSLKRTGLFIDFAMMTASLHSSSLPLVLVVAHETESPKYYVFCWEPNGSGNRDGMLVVDMKIVSFALFKNQVYYIDKMMRVGVVEFEPKMSCKLLGDMSFEKLPTSGDQILKLVECDGELLIVLVVKNPNRIRGLDYSMKIEVYKVDLEKRRCDKKEKLNNWCLFIDPIGKTGFSCKHPEIWGLKSNYIYFPILHGRSFGCCLINENTKVPVDFVLGESPPFVSPF